MANDPFKASRQIRTNLWGGLGQQAQGIFDGEVCRFVELRVEDPQMSIAPVWNELWKVMRR